MKLNLIIIVVIIVTAILTSFVVVKVLTHNIFTDKIIPEEFNVEMKALSGEDVAKLYPGAIDNTKDIFKRQIYVFGRILNNGNSPAGIAIDIECKQKRYLGMNDIQTGWIWPKREYPVFFLTRVGEIHSWEAFNNEEVHNLEFTYKITDVSKKYQLSDKR